MVQIATQTNLSKPVRGIPEPTLAYVIYESGGVICATTRHVIKDNRLGLGRVVSAKQITRDLASRQSVQRVELLPGNVLAANENLLAWYSRPVYAPMWFSLQGKARGLHVTWPRLLWVAEKQPQSLRVYAIGTASRPTATTRLYHAPLMNIGADGRLCEGSARLPRDIGVGSMDAIEACVRDSHFTHVNHENTIKGGASTMEHFRFWRQIEREKRPVRVKELNYAGTLAEVLDA